MSRVKRDVPIRSRVLQPITTVTIIKKIKKNNRIIPGRTEQNPNGFMFELTKTLTISRTTYRLRKCGLNDIQSFSHL